MLLEHGIIDFLRGLPAIWTRLRRSRFTRHQYRHSTLSSLSLFRSLTSTMTDPSDDPIRRNAHVHISSTTLSTEREPGSILTILFWNLATFMTQTFSFVFLSKAVHYFVQCLDEIYDVTGRKSRSKFEGVKLGRIVLGVGLLLGWHVWIVRLSVVSTSALDEGGKEEGARDEGDERGIRKRVSWGRILGRVLVPAFLVLSSTLWSIQLASQLLFSETLDGDKSLKEGMS